MIDPATLVPLTLYLSLLARAADLGGDNPDPVSRKKKEN